MYRLLLCLRYVRSRAIAIPSIITVILGVVTLTVVHSVMGGFAKEMRERIRGTRADVLVRSRSLAGFEEVDERIKLIQRTLGQRIVALAPVVQAFGLINYKVAGESVQQPVELIGIRPAEKAKVGRFAKYLNLQQDSDPPSFAVKGDVRRWHELFYGPYETVPGDGGVPETPGCIVGRGIISIVEKDLNGRTVRDDNGNVIDRYLLEPGNDVAITTFGRKISGTGNPARYQKFTVVDDFKSGMSEYDSHHVYVPFAELQRLRGMDEGNRANLIEIKVADYQRDARDVVEAIRDIKDEAGQPMFRVERFVVETWEENLGTLLAAVAVESTILIIIMFFIILAAGFGIFGIFMMIVVEKTRDIGVVKALGASNQGIQSIFLGYGVALGVIGSSVGLTLALIIIKYLDQIETFLSNMLGIDVFPRDIYYFDRIPRYVDWRYVSGFIIGSILISTLASVYPAWKASRCDPVEALRYE